MNSDNPFNNTGVCYYPDGQPSKQTPCDPNAPHTACCNVLESCSRSGVCLGNGGLFYRGSCTDKTWASKACPDVCTDSVGVNSGPGGKSDDVWMKLCRVGDRGGNWTCTFDDGCDDASKRFWWQDGTGPITSINITGMKEVSVNTSSGTVTGPSCAAGSTTAPIIGAPITADSQSCPSTGKIVGASLSPPLVLLFLVILAWIFWERRRRQISLQIFNSAAEEAVYRETKGIGTTKKPAELGAKYVPAEMP